MSWPGQILLRTTGIRTMLTRWHYWTVTSSTVMQFSRIILDCDWVTDQEQQPRQSVWQWLLQIQGRTWFALLKGIKYLMLLCLDISESVMILVRTPDHDSDIKHSRITSVISRCLSCVPEQADIWVILPNIKIQHFYGFSWDKTLIFFFAMGFH